MMKKGVNKSHSDKIEISIVHSNIDAYTSKKKSLDKIADCGMPDVITFNETLLTGKKTLKKKNYMFFFVKPRF